MLVVRQEQLDLFQKANRARFEAELVCHVNVFTPQLYKVVGEKAACNLVRLALARAESYAFADRLLIRFYLELMLTLGVNFDTDPQFSWAKMILNDTITPAQVRASQLYTRLGEYVQRVVGPGNQHLLNAYDRFISIQASNPSDSFPNHPGALRSWLLRVFPEKHDYCDAAQLNEIIREASAAVSRFRLPQNSGSVAVAIAMLMFGHGVLTDPMYPWVGSVLNDPLVSSPDQRITRLVAKLKLYTDRSVQFLKMKGDLGGQKPSN